MYQWVIVTLFVIKTLKAIEQDVYFGEHLVFFKNKEMEQNLLLDFLLERTYYFFPKGIMGYREEYPNSEEFRRLSERCRYYWENQEQWLHFRQLVKELFPDRKLRDNTRIFIRERCYHLAIIIENSTVNLKMLNLCISILVPYYHIYISEFEKIPAEQIYYVPVKHDNNLSDYPEEEEKLSELIQKVFMYNKFPDSVLEYIIPDVSYDWIMFNEFNMFNAFFLDSYEKI